jgi:ribosomal protein S18 acetylase RimI-like enzyme
MPIITRAVTEDAEAILALQSRAYVSEAQLYNDWTIPPLTQTLQSLRNEINSTIVLKAVEGQSIVGSVRGKTSGDTCSIGRLIVEPQLQGQGIGTSLIKAIEAFFPEAKRFDLFTGSKSEGNIRLYSRNGYKIVRQKQLSELLTLVFMSKPAHTAA